MPLGVNERHEQVADPAVVPPLVLHVITRMVKGGAQENVLDKAVGLDPARFRCILATGPSEGPEGSLIQKAADRGAQIREIPCLVREVSPLNDVRAITALVRLMRRERPAIVHTHTSKAGIVGRIAARVTRTPVVIHEPHGHVFHGYYGKLKTRVFIAIERWCARYAHRLVMLTANERADHLALKIAPADKFITIHSGIDFAGMKQQTEPAPGLRAQFNLDANARIIGTIGRLVDVKGQVHLIDAMPAVREKFANAHLVLVGSGPLLDELQQRARDIGIQDAVHFSGYRADIGNCLKDMDVFVLPSKNEGMGRVLVEAMAMRVPVIASDVCGIRDLVRDGETGRLVPPGNAAAIAEAVTAILSDRQLADRLSDAGYRFVVPDFGVDAMITATERLYSSELKRAAALRNRGSHTGPT